MVKINKKEDIFVRSSFPPDIRITFWSEEFFDLPYCVDCKQKITNDDVSYIFETYAIPFKFLKILEEQNTSIKHIDIFNYDLPYFFQNYIFAYSTYGYKQNSNNQYNLSNFSSSQS